MGELERLPCDPNSPCPLRETARGCFEDVHHREWPRRVYEEMGAAAVAYRELPENKDRRCRNLHNIEHEVTDPPFVVDREFMIMALTEAVNRGDVHFSKTKKRKIFGNGGQE